MPKAIQEQPSPTTGGVRPNIGMQFAFAFRALADRHAEILDELDAGWLKPSHAYLLHAVADESQSVKQLSELMQVTKQAMSMMVDQLEQRGLVTRSINGTDRRARDIAITGPGVELLEVAKGAWQRVEAEVAETVGPAAYSILSEALETYLSSRPGTSETRRWRPVW